MPYVRLYSGNTLKQQWELTDDGLTIGRADDNDVVLPDTGVSKHHARIERRGNGFAIVDNDSANGVFVNNQRVSDHVLKYWDEIQVFNHVLKYMASAKLQGEEDGPLSAALQPEQESTMAVDIKSLGDLDALKQRLTRAWVAPAESADGQPRQMVDREPVSVGKGRDCDLQARGWFAPRQAARFEKRDDGVYLIPFRRGRVRVNDRRVKAPYKLDNNDLIAIRGLQLRYYCRPLFKA